MSWGTGSVVETQKSKDSSILYSDYGVTPLYQYTETTVSEKRGMTKAAAQGEVSVSDSTAQRTYCRMVNGELVGVQVKTGTLVTKAASRSNEADGWTVVTTTTVYTTSSLDGWTAAPSGATTITYANASKSKDSQLLYSNGTVNVYQYVETTESTAKNINETEAMAAVGVTDSTTQTVYYRVVDGDLQTISVQGGSVTRITATREQNGVWTVSKSVTSYSSSSLTGWSTAFSGTGVQTKVSKQIASSILFAKNGATTIYQIETEEVTEYRGCGGGASGAEGLVVFSDNTTNTQYWASIDEEVFSISVTSGTRTTWSATRQANGVWVAVKRVTTFSVSPTIQSPWGTTKLDQNGQAAELTATGVSHRANLEKSFSWETSCGNDSLLTSVERKDTIVEYVSTESAAQAIVNSNTANTINYVSVGHLLYVFLVPVYVWRQVPVGVIKTASASYSSAERGWTVTIIETTYGYTGTGWSTNPSSSS